MFTIRLHEQYRIAPPGGHNMFYRTGATKEHFVLWLHTPKVASFNHSLQAGQSALLDHFRRPSVRLLLLPPTIALLKKPFPTPQEAIPDTDCLHNFGIKR